MWPFYDLYGCHSEDVWEAVNVCLGKVDTVLNVSF